MVLLVSFSIQFQILYIWSRFSDDDFFEHIIKCQAPFIEESKKSPDALVCLQYIQSNQLPVPFLPQDVSQGLKGGKRKVGKKQSQDKSQDTTDGNVKRSKKKGYLVGLKSHLENCPDWPNWKFSVQIKVKLVKKNEDQSLTKEKSVKVEAEINLIQAATIRRDIEQVKIITGIALDQSDDGTILDKLLKEEMVCTLPDEFKEKGWDLPSHITQNCSWILDATAVHLASCWHVESLVHFLEFDGRLSNIKTDSSLFTPLHVASVEEEPRCISVLIRNEADVNARNSFGQTPLHIAAQHGSMNNLITLIFQGDADVLALNQKNQTPIHLARTCKILEILLSKTKIEELTKLKGDQCVFEHIVKNCPSSVNCYLDLMVTCKNSETNINDQQLLFHLDMFNHGTKKSSNYLEKHKMLMDNGCPEMLRHPVMMFFTSLKWYPHKTWYYTNFFLFLAFLLTFTFHGINCINFLQCHKEGEPNKTTIETQKDCVGKIESMYEVTRFTTWVLLGLLILWEFFQFLSKLLTNEIGEYFTSWQNICELIMFSLSIAFFVFEKIELDDIKSRFKIQDSGIQEHLLGWALYLAWLNLTIFLGRFDLFGKHIYRSWHVLKNVAVSMIVYIPILMAFATGFHCFLKNHPTFEGPVASLLKVLTMVLGEFDFEDNFVYDKVTKIHGSNVSVQFMFIVFIVQGSMIIMNLITAWIVVNQQDATETKLILAKQRIEEISGMTQIMDVMKCLPKKPNKNPSLNVPSYLCVSSTPKSRKIPDLKVIKFL